MNVYYYITYKYDIHCFQIHLKRLPYGLKTYNYSLRYVYIVKRELSPKNNRV